MLFNSLKYALFLPIVFAVFWMAPQRFRVPILLIASYVFYMSWRPIYILLIIALTVGNYFIGGAIHRSAERSHSKGWLAAGVAFNLITLGFFKYAYFVDDTLQACLHPAGVNVPSIPFDIVLPLGISFFVFEFIHYLTDIYRGHKPVDSFLGFSLFASFFPTQIAGPIKRFQDFVPQFLAPAKFKMEYIDEGLPLILLGLFKKVMLADNLALFVAGGFGHPNLFNGADLWIFTYAFAFQIYFDFSGYTDVARGSAKLFGYKVPINFNLPYLANSIADFWHRWHISLSTWLRDYLFIPLGGSRVSRFLNYRNLMITMTLGGLWHGAAMHFVAWGVYHGALLIAHKQAQKWIDGMSWLRQFMDSKLGYCLSVLVTFHAVCIGWVLFRAETTASGLLILRRMFFLESVPGQPMFHLVLPSINYPLIYPSIYLLLPLLVAGHILMGQINRRNWIARVPFPARAAWCFIMMFAVLVFSPDKSPRFIYFQF
jgi:alginate O-acetyltransferase complex protein AlgI